METLMKYLVSYLGQDRALVANTSHACAADQVVAGYCSADSCDEEELQGPAGILYADIVDYSRLSEHREIGVRARLVDSMEHFRAVITANSGRLAHFAGDAILAEFNDVDSALGCAIKVQLASRQWNADLDLPRQVRFRIGVSFGEVIATRGNVYHDAVKLAARLESLACAGSICVSKNVRSISSAGSTYRFVGTGKRYLKHAGKPVETFWILIGSEQITELAMHGTAGLPDRAS
jgi:class 3 adenylate cyclase